MLDKTLEVLSQEGSDTNAGPCSDNTLLLSFDLADLTIKTRFMKTSINKLHEGLLGYLRQQGVS